MIKLPDETEMKWRDLALQFDGHRMQAISLLKMIIKDASDDQYLSVRNFLKSGPLQGEEVLRNRIAEIAEAQHLNSTAQPKCQKCGDTGMADSGGTQSWGEPILIDCDCATAQQKGEPSVHAGKAIMQFSRLINDGICPKTKTHPPAQPVSDGWIFESCENEPCPNGAVVNVIGDDIHLCAACAGDKKYSRMKITALPKRLSLPLPAAPGGQDA